jgi:hypothetical protein
MDCQVRRTKVRFIHHHEREYPRDGGEHGRGSMPGGRSLKATGRAPARNQAVLAPWHIRSEKSMDVANRCAKEPAQISSCVTRRT